MIRSFTSVFVLIAFGSLTVSPLAVAQSLDTPMTRMRPIGSPSAVDQYRTPPTSGRYYQTAYQGGAPVRHADFVDSAANQPTVSQQQFTFAPPPIPESGSATAPPSESPFSILESSPPPTDFPPASSPSSGLSSTAPSVGLPSTSLPAQPRGLPLGSGTLAPVPMTSSSSDLAPLAQPQLNDGFATIDNCACVSPPSSYVAATSWGPCAPVSYQAPIQYQAPPAYLAQPTDQSVIATPNVLPPSIPARGSGIPRGPLISFGQDRNPVQIGQGIVGQPVAYVPGQRIRNWIRYIFP